MYTRFRVGFDKDGVYVWDREIQSELKELCILWCRDSEKFDIYETRLISIYVKPVKENSIVQIAVKKYLKWFSENGTKWINTGRAVLIGEIEAARQRKIAKHIEQIEIAHNEFLCLAGKPNNGLRKASVGHRSSQCYKCHSRVDNIVDMECCSCGWIVCPNCGACGCGYSSASSEGMQRAPIADYQMGSSFANEQHQSNNESAGEIREEISDYAESIARSNEDGWFYDDNPPK